MENTFSFISPVRNTFSFISPMRNTFSFISPVRNTSFNSSWLKFFAVVSGGVIMETLRPLLQPLPFLLYCGHNLYAEQQYYKEIEYNIQVKINDEIHTIKASPEKISSYTVYNVLGCVSHLMNLMHGIALGNTVQNNQSSDNTVQNNQSSGNTVQYNIFLTIWSTIGCGIILSKVISLFDDYVDYNFTDMTTGEVIPYTLDEHHYYTLQCNNSIHYTSNKTHDQVICSNSHELIFDNPVMEADA